MVEELGLVDIWRTQHPLEKRFTWRNANRKKSRLDCLLISEHIAHLVSDSDTDLAYRSDHSAISLSIWFDNEKCGKGFWELNSRLLKSTLYMEMVKTVISETMEEDSTTEGDIDYESAQLNIDDQTFFEIIKCKIRSASIQLSVNQCKQKARNKIH